MKRAISRRILGESSIVASCVFFAVGAVLVKFVSGSVNVLFISFCNFGIGMIVGIALLFGSRNSFVIHDTKYLVLRGGFGAIAMVLYFVAIHLANSGRATLLNTTFPLFSAIFGYCLFQEKLSLNSAIGLLLCIVGTCFVFFDKSGGGLLGNSVGLLSGASGGMAAHYVKKARERNHSIIVYLSACVGGLLITAFSVPQATQVNGKTLMMLLAIGGLSFVAQVLMSYGFKYTTATEASIITFFKIPLTLMLSFLVLDEMMKLRFLTGALLIVAGLVLNSWKMART